MPDRMSPVALCHDYVRTAREYLASLKLENFMEGTSQARQRLFTTTAFEQIHALRPDVQAFNELLVQYDHGRPPRRRGVVPDNMVCVHGRELIADGSFDVPFQPVKPLLVMEYVSPGNERKDYEASYEKYEKELKVPYYLVFYAKRGELTLFRHDGKRYVTVLPNERGRYEIPELEVELALAEGWVRFWFRGERLEMPSQMRQERDDAVRERDEILAERDEVRAERDDALAERDDAVSKAKRLEDEIAELRRRLAGP